MSAQTHASAARPPLTATFITTSETGAVSRSTVYVTLPPSVSAAAAEDTVAPGLSFTVI